MKQNALKIHRIIDSKNYKRNYILDIWKYRELLFFIVWRDILVRYKQTLLGVAWSIIRPLMTMVVFTIIFRNIAGLSSDGLPYPVMVYSALLPWQLFASTVEHGSDSLIYNSTLVTKINLPRIILPTSSLLVCLVDFCIAFVVLAGLMLWYQYMPGLHILILPLFTLMTCTLALGTVYWFSALNVKYRDFKYIIPFFLQIGLFLSPIGFSGRVVPEKFRIFYNLNPFSGIIEGFRWGLGAGQEFSFSGILVSLLIVSLVFLSGIVFFIKSEKRFADII
jgi:lipopolysaccharide transport system permease protein